MKPLEFSDVIGLLNNSRVIYFEPKASVRSTGNWEIYNGEYRVHLSKTPFSVLYIQSRATVVSIRQAKEKVLELDKIQVVFAPSLDKRVQTHRELFEGKAAGFWNTRDYLASILSTELEAYRTKISGLKPKFYIAPPIKVPAGMARKIPNPVQLLLTDTDTGRLGEAAALGIVLAEPGQGKTYMSQFLVSELSSNRKDIVPIYIDSNQWQALRLEDLGSLWKTIANSFRHLGTPIGWIEGCEGQFIRIMLKAGLFRIVFDGFDEYILRNHGQVKALDTLDVLINLSEETDSRLVVTSRTTFWESEIVSADADKQLSENKCVSIYEIQPFDSNQAHQYFENRLKDKNKVNAATAAFDTLKKRGKSFVGRGFVLSLIADLYEEDNQPMQLAVVGSPLQWLMNSICERETIRQKLPITGAQQLKIIRTFISDVVQGSPDDAETLEYAIVAIDPTLDTETRKFCITKLAQHPLINEQGDQWVIPQEQIKVALIAEELVDLAGPDREGKALASFSKNSKLESGFVIDVASMIVENSESQKTSEGATIKHLRNLAASFIACGERSHDCDDRSSVTREIAVLIAQKYVDKILPKGESRLERYELLIKILPNGELKGLPFARTITSMDFSGVTFDSCRFDNVRWANCKLDESTLFKNCHFVGGSKVNCSGFGVAKFLNLTTDEKGKAFISSSQIEAGKRKYSEDDLKADLEAIIRKFIGKGGLGFNTVTQRHIKSGPVATSKYSDQIITEVQKKLLHKHHISGTKEVGLNIREDVEECIKFYAANNVFTGALQETFKALKTKLKL